MTHEERVKAYCHFSEQLYKQYRDRRHLEWKIHVALWTALAATGYAFMKEDKHLHYSSLWLILAVVLHLIWCVKIHIGEFRDRDFSIRYRQAAERLLGPAPVPTEGEGLIDAAEPTFTNRPPKWVEQRFEPYLWWLGAELGTTLLIAYVVIYLVW